MYLQRNNIVMFKNYQSKAVPYKCKESFMNLRYKNRLLTESLFAFLLHIRVNKFNLANMNIRFLIIHSLSFSYITKTYYSLFCR